MVMEGRRESDRGGCRRKEVAPGFLVNVLGWRKASHSGGKRGAF